MDAGLRDFVRDRAGHRCEYCHLPQAAEPFFTYHIEHIVARQHGGGDDDLNLLLPATIAIGTRDQTSPRSTQVPPR
jgi:hypothetical protein